METISAPTRPAGAARDAARDQRLAALAARRAPAAQRTTPRSGDRVDRVAPADRSKRRHAAKGARAVSLGLSLASTGALASFFALSNGQSGTQLQAATIVAAPGAAATASPAAASTATQTVTPTPTVVELTIAPAAAPAAVAAPASVPATTPPAVAAPVVAQTVVQGGVFHNKWGDVQVQAIFAADGTLVDVTAMQTPDRDRKSVRINDRAVPQLNTEALAVQSAQVDTVSGATYTSNDYRNSLQSAIDAANAAGLTAIG